MILAIDIGNSEIVITEIFSEKSSYKIGNNFRFLTNKTKSVKDYITEITKVVKLEKTNKVIISSVVPELTEVFAKIALQKTKKTAFILDETHQTNLNFLIEENAKVGADMVAAAVAAKKLHGDELIIIDFGTATTFSLIHQGNFEGAAIAPGPVISMNALSIAASKLPYVSFERPKNSVAKNTKDAMLSGIYYGHLGMVREIIQQFKRKSPSAKIIATGGLAEHFINEKIFDAFEPNLVVIGTYEIWQMNQSNSLKEHSNATIH